MSKVWQHEIMEEVSRIVRRTRLIGLDQDDEAKNPYVVTLRDGKRVVVGQGWWNKIDESDGLACRHTLVRLVDGQAERELRLIETGQAEGIASIHSGTEKLEDGAVPVKIVRSNSALMTGILTNTDVSQLTVREDQTPVAHRKDGFWKNVDTDRPGDVLINRALTILREVNQLATQEINLRA